MSHLGGKTNVCIQLAVKGKQETREKKDEDDMQQRI